MSDAGTKMKRPPGPSPGDVLHQRSSLGKSPVAMAVGGFVFIGALAYFTLLAKSKPGTGPSEAAKVLAGPPPK